MSAAATSADSSSAPSLDSSPPNLLAVIIDCTTFTWTHRSLARTAKDKALAAQNKPSAGPATLDDVVSSVLVLGSCLACSNRDNALVVIAATEGEVGVIYPRKGGEGSSGSMLKPDPQSTISGPEAVFANKKTRLLRNLK